MEHGKLKVTKIVDELVNYFLNLGCSDIDVNIKDYGIYYAINLKLNKKCISNTEICKLKKLLNLGKQEEMEEFYWSLTGDCDVDTELSIVGMMSDRVIIDDTNGDEISITIERKK